MTQQILISVEDLLANLKKKACVVVDCRFALGDPGAGYGKYLEAHIPRAVYAHLDNDLSSPIGGSSGRHPLPDADKFAAFLARSGWQPGDRLVAYDDAGGAIGARLWWLMKYFGHEGAALLDGGFPAWQSAGYALESGPQSAAATTPVSFVAHSDFVVSSTEVMERLAGPDNTVLVDVRAGERFRGEIEPLDSVAGHIPGSVNYPYQQNLSGSGRFKPAQDIRRELSALQGDHPPKDVVYMCGSGVTACHTLFAAELAGLHGAKLYAGSWSEWIRDLTRPVEPKTG